MMTKVQSFMDSLGWLAQFLPPAFGALLGLKWAQGQTNQQKVVSFAFGMGLSIYFAPAVAEVLGQLPDKSPRIFAVISILTAIIGMDVLTGFVAISKSFALSPLQTFKDWWAAWRNR
jgi:hypothetical protein